MTGKLDKSDKQGEMVDRLTDSQVYDCLVYIFELKQGGDALNFQRKTERLAL